MQGNARNLNFRFIGWFFLLNAFLYLIFGFAYLQSIISSPTLFKNLVFEYTSWFGKGLVVVFIITTYFSYLVFLAFIPSFLAFFLALFVRNKKIITCFSVFIGYLSLFLIIIDSRLFLMYKFHLSITLLQMILGKSVSSLLDLSDSEIFIIFAVAVLLFLFLIFFAFVVWKFLIPKRTNFGKSVTIFWLGTALFSYFSLMLSISIQHNNLLIQQAANLPYYNNLLALAVPQKNAKDTLNRFSEGSYMQAQFSHDNLKYPKKLMRCVQNPKNAYNIIFITIDSLRKDSIDHMPNTARFAKNSWQFLQHYSGGNSTQAGLFTLFYSIPSSYWTAALEQNVGPVFIDLLLENNYETKVIWSNEMHNPPMYKTIYNKLTNLNLETIDSDNSSDWDRDSTARAIQFLKDSKLSNKPFFLNIFYNAPHAFCRVRDFPLKYKPIAEECSRLNMSNSSPREPLYNSYLNTVDFIDVEIKKVLDVIADNSFLDNSIVVITSDHGQEFNDNHLNYWGHASNYSKYQVQVPLIIHWPHTSPHKFTHLTTHYDLMPTLLSRVFNCANNPRDYSIGKDLFNDNENQKFVLVGSYVNSGIIEKDRLTTLHVSGDITITDLHLQPLYNSKPRVKILYKALKIMREFYMTKEVSN